MPTINCTGPLTLFKPTFVGLGAVIHATSGHPSFKTITAAGLAAVMETATAPLTLPLITVSGQGATVKKGTAAINLKPMTAAATGVVVEVGTGALGLKALTSAGAVTVKETARGALTLKLLSVAGTVDVFGFPGDQIGEPELATGPYVHRETQFTIVHSDRERLVVCISGSAVTVTLPEAVGAFGRGFRTQLLNLGAGIVTITPAAGLINESTNPAVLFTNDDIELWSDGANWYGVGGTTMQSTTVTLTDADIKALPTTEFTLIPAPDTGKTLKCFGAYGVLHLAAAYTNIDSAAKIINFISENGVSLLGTVDATSFMGSGPADNIIDIPAYGNVDVTNNNLQGSLGAKSGAEGPLVLFASNGSLGDFTGGDTANTLTLTTYYVVQAL